VLLFGGRPLGEKLTVWSHFEPKVMEVDSSDDFPFQFG